MSAQIIKIHRIEDLKPGDILMSLTNAPPEAGNWNVSREVPDLPTKPGSLGRATVRGVRDTLIVRAEEGSVAGEWFSPLHIHAHPLQETRTRWHFDADISDFVPLAAVSEEQIADLVHDMFYGGEDRAPSRAVATEWFTDRLGGAS